MRQDEIVGDREQSNWDPANPSSCPKSPGFLITPVQITSNFLTPASWRFNEINQLPTCGQTGQRWQTVQTVQTGHTGTHSKQLLTFKLDFPRHLCKAAFVILAMFHRKFLVHICFDKIKLLCMWSNQTARQRVAFYTTAVTAEFQRQLYNFWQHHYLLATPCLPTCPPHILLVHFWSETDHFPALRLKSHLVLRCDIPPPFLFIEQFNFFLLYIHLSRLFEIHV